jgi:hypothetical protein
VASSSTDPPPLCSMPFLDASEKYPPFAPVLQLQTLLPGIGFAKPPSLS